MQMCILCMYVTLFYHVKRGGVDGGDGRGMRWGQWALSDKGKEFTRENSEGGMGRFTGEGKEGDEKQKRRLR